MSIREISEKIKGLVGEREKDFFILVTIILVAILGYGLGRLAELEEGRKPVQIVQPVLVTEGVVLSVDNKEGLYSNIKTDNTQNNIQKGKFVASKSGAKYHYPWCSGAQRIKEENKIWFETIEEALYAGYSPAANCPGLP